MSAKVKTVDEIVACVKEEVDLRGFCAYQYNPHDSVQKEANIRLSELMQLTPGEGDLPFGEYLYVPGVGTSGYSIAFICRRTKNAINGVVIDLAKV